MNFGRLTRTKSRGGKRGSLGLSLIGPEPEAGGVASPVPGDGVPDSDTTPSSIGADDPRSPRSPLAEARSPDDFADDDGVSETSTRNTGAAATKQLAAVRGWRLKEESARVSDLEGQLKDSKAELKQERAKLSALGTRLAAVEATLRLERESIRPDREALVSVAERAVGQAAKMHALAHRSKRECATLQEANTRLRSEVTDLAARQPTPSGSSGQPTPRGSSLMRSFSNRASKTPSPKDDDAAGASPAVRRSRSFSQRSPSVSSTSDRDGRPVPKRSGEAAARSLGGPRSSSRGGFVPRRVATWTFRGDGSRPRRGNLRDDASFG